jgi:predicted RNase H-like HicB family nuclease
MDSWYWFGILVDRAGHVKLRQYHVRQQCGQWVVVSWSKGLAGKLWHVRSLETEAGIHCRFKTFGEALAQAREMIDLWARGYVLIDEGEPPRPDYHQAQSQPSGVADPDWWAAALGVPVDCDNDEAKAAFRQRAMETHPDRGGDADEFRRVFAAWEYVKEVRGWR